MDWEWVVKSWLLVMKLWQRSGREKNLEESTCGSPKAASITHQTRSTIMPHLWHNLSKGGWCHFGDQRSRNLTCASFDEIGVHLKMMLVERNWYSMQQAYEMEAKSNHTTMSGFIHFCQSHDATGEIGNQNFIVLVTARESSWKLSSREKSRSTLRLNLFSLTLNSRLKKRPAKWNLGINWL